MVDLLASPIIGDLLGIAFSTLVEEEIPLILGVDDKIKKLQSNLTAIQATLNDAERRQIEEEQIRDWLGKLKDAAEDAVDILDIFATKTFLWKRKHQRRRISTPVSPTKFVMRSNIARNIERILARLDIIAEERKKFHLIMTSNTQSLERPLADFVDTSRVLGRESYKEKIIDQLQSDQQAKLSVIPIIGMAGIGKTTLAQIVYGDRRIKECFDLMTWVSVSTDFNWVKILKAMMESDHSNAKLLADISSDAVSFHFRKFIRGKRFFLVLLDAWEDKYLKWEFLVQLLRSGEKGSRVLVTSRSQKVAEVVGTQPPILLEGLPADESWLLFHRIAFRIRSEALEPRLQNQLEEIGKEIVGRCKGLPLAIKAMAGLLCGNTDVDNWRRILKSNIWELEDQEILPALTLGYHNLPPHLKRCFAYCSIFPKGYAFDKEELVKLWMAQSFIQSREQISAEHIGSSYFDVLVARSFFQQLNIDNKVLYRMHDLNHDLAILISGPECCQIKDSNAQLENSQGWRHVSLLCQDVERPCFKLADRSKKLRTLVFPHYRSKNFGNSLPTLFYSLKHTRALDLSFSTVDKLPSSIKKLKLLRYLDLSHTKIERLPNSICNLCNLQTLKLLGCVGLSQLPRDLGDLINLRHLELDDDFWFKCTSFPPNIGNIKGLHNLHKFIVGCQAGYEIKQLKEMAELTGTLHISNLENAVEAAEARLNEKERLQKLVFEWSSRNVDPPGDATDEQVLKDLQPHKYLKELVVSYYEGARFPPWMTDGYLQYLVNISLTHCINCKILDLQPLPFLEILCIENLPELTTLGCSSLEVLRETEVQRITKNDLKMKVINCPKLQALPYFLAPQELETSECKLLNALPVNYAKCLQRLELDKIDNGIFLRLLPETGSLQSLAISNISNMVCLPKLPHLPALKALYIRNCKDLVSLSEEEGEESFRSEKIAALPNEGLPSGLECLIVQSCCNLQALGKKDTLKSLTLLKDFYIEDCPMLQSFPENGLPTFLQHLRIRKCPQLAEKCKEGTGAEWVKVAHIPDLELELELDLIQPSSVPKPELSKKKPRFLNFIHRKGRKREFRRKMEMGECSTSTLPEQKTRN